METLPPNVVSAVAEGQALGVEVHARHFPAGARSAADAARAIDVEVSKIVKSLAFLVDGALVMALMPGDSRLDEAKLAATAQGQSARRADADAVRAATGYPIGGVAPWVGAGKSQPPTYVDAGLLRHDEVWAALGHPDWCFPIAPSDLVRATQATVCDLAHQP